MKITCSKCGKRFDAEDHLYICPKCNHYHSQTGTHGHSRETVSASNLFDKTSSTSDLFKEKKTTSDLLSGSSKTKDVFKEKKNSLDGSVKNKLKDKLEGVNVMDALEDIIVGDYSSDNSNDDTPEFIQTLNGDQRVYTARKKTEEESSDFFGDVNSVGKKIGLAVCIIVGFIMLISSTIGEFDEWSDDENSWNSGWESSYTEDIEVAYGEPMEFETFTVNVTGVGDPDVNGLKPSDNKKFVQVDFSSDQTVDDESIDSEVMLEIDGREYYALYEDDITNKVNLQNELWESGLDTYAHYNMDGYWIFEIPESAEAADLIISSYIIEDGDSSWYSELILDEQIRMPIPVIWTY